MEPIISIYDLLVKHHKQLKKEEPIKEVLPTKATSQVLEMLKPVAIDRSPVDLTKKPRGRVTRTKVGNELKTNMPQQGQQIGSNMVTASHLTRKPSVMKVTNNKKELLVQQMFQNMAKRNKTRTNEREEAGNIMEPTPHKKPSKHVSVGKSKTSKIFNSTNPRKRLILSPRNINTNNTTTVKRDKATKTKANIDELKPLNPSKNSAVGARMNKMRLNERKSKVTNTSSIENNIHYHRL